MVSSPVCADCASELERHRIGRGRDQNGAGSEVWFCPTCNTVAPAPAHAEGYSPPRRRDIDG